MRPGCLLGQSADGRELSSLGETVPTEVTLHTLGYLTLVPGWSFAPQKGVPSTLPVVCLELPWVGAEHGFSTCCFTLLQLLSVFRSSPGVHGVSVHWTKARDTTVHPLAGLVE